MKKFRFYTPEIGQVGMTRWFDDADDWPKLNWSNVTGIETSETMTVDEFKAKYPLAELPE